MKKRGLFFVFALLLLTSVAAQEVNYLLSSHILDIQLGQPAPDVKITLSKQNADLSWTVIDEKITDDNGRVKDFLPGNAGIDHRGIYKLTYHVGPYFALHAQESFYPFIEVVFEMKDNSHYHVPITLSPYGYSTYRGS